MRTVLVIRDEASGGTVRITVESVGPEPNSRGAAAMFDDAVYGVYEDWEMDGVTVEEE